MFNFLVGLFDSIQYNATLEIGRDLYCSRHLCGYWWAGLLYVIYTQQKQRNVKIHCQHAAQNEEELHIIKINSNGVCAEYCVVQNSKII